MSKFKTILTNVGEKAIADATANGTKINFTHIVVGDGDGYSPSKEQLELYNEVDRIPIDRVSVTSDNDVKVTGGIRLDTPSYTIREIGLVDSKDRLISVGLFPETEKPSLHEGIGKMLEFSYLIAIRDVDVFEIKVNEDIAYITREEYEEHIKEWEEDKKYILQKIEGMEISEEEFEKIKKIIEVSNLEQLEKIKEILDDMLLSIDDKLQLISVVNRSIMISNILGRRMPEDLDLLEWSLRQLTELQVFGETLTELYELNESTFNHLLTIYDVVGDEKAVQEITNNDKVMELVNDSPTFKKLMDNSQEYIDSILGTDEGIQYLINNKERMKYIVESKAWVNSFNKFSEQTSKLLKDMTWRNRIISTIDFEKLNEVFLSDSWQNILNDDVAVFNQYMWRVEKHFTPKGVNEFIIPQSILNIPSSKVVFSGITSFRVAFIRYLHTISKDDFDIVSKNISTYGVSGSNFSYGYRTSKSADWYNENLMISFVENLNLHRDFLTINSQFNGWGNQYIVHLLAENKQFCNQLADLSTDIVDYMNDQQGIYNLNVSATNNLVEALSKSKHIDTELVEAKLTNYGTIRDSEASDSSIIYALHSLKVTDNKEGSIIIENSVGMINDNVASLHIPFVKRRRAGIIGYITGKQNQKIIASTQFIFKVALRVRSSYGEVEYYKFKVKE